MPREFNPPPGWTPSPNWQPDPSWPAPPAGWSFWIDEPSAAPQHLSERELQAGAASSNKARARKPWNRLPGVRQLVAGAIIVVLGGLGLSYAESWLGFNRKVPDLQVDALSVSPGNVYNPSKVDVKVLNNGSQLAAINSATVVIQKFAVLPLCSGQGEFTTTGSYQTDIPNDPLPGQRVTIPVSQLVPAGGADRFDLLFRVPFEQGHAKLNAYIYRVRIYLNYNVSTNPLNLGEVILVLPLDPDGGQYYWNRYYASHMAIPRSVVLPSQWAAYMRCVVENSYRLRSILNLPGLRSSDLTPVLAQLRY